MTSRAGFRQVIGRAKSELSHFRRRTCKSRFVPEAENPYATHLPVLMGIARLVAPQRVLELGGGLISTPALANPVAFPSVMHLHTFEDDAVWGQRIRAAVHGLQHVRIEDTESIPEHAEGMELESYDLIFIDNSVRTGDRARTIAAVLARCPPSTVIVIHDFEWRAYRRSVPAQWQQFTMMFWRPATGIVWRTRLTRTELRWLAATLVKGRHIDLTDVTAWNAHFDREMR